MKPAARKTVRQLTDLSPAMLRRLRRVLNATKGMRAPEAREVLGLALVIRTAEASS